MIEIPEPAKAALENARRLGLVKRSPRLPHRHRNIFGDKSDPIQTHQWPFWAKALKQLSKPEDKGLGDVIARVIGDENSSAFKSWHLETFGKPCGCNGRKSQLNQHYPLSVPLRH
jgi:hypothetical protein